MPLDLEFHITVGGVNLTPDVMEWSLTDTEKGKSSIDVILASRGNKYVDFFNGNDEVSLTWGTANSTLGPVQFKIKGVTSGWGHHGTTVDLHAIDWTERLDSQSSRGVYPEGTGTDEIIEDTIERSGLTPRVDVKSAKVPPDTRHPIPGMVHRDIVKRFGDFSSNLKNGKSDIASSLRSGVTKPKDKPNIKGGIGPTLGKITPKAVKQENGDEDSKEKTMEENFLENQAKEAASYSLKADLTIVDYPFMKAKECVTILGVGATGSGDWYVQSVKHSWKSESGYVASCHLMKPEAPEEESGGEGKQGGKKGGAPNVCYAEIFEKNVVYCGPRKLDAPSQMTFYVGDGQHVVSFSWTLDIQTPKDAGDQMAVEERPVNSDNIEQKAAWSPLNKPPSSGGDKPTPAPSPDGGYSPWP